MVNRNNKHGGSMPLSYLKSSYSEPSVGAGSDVLSAQAGLARPVLHHTGGKTKGTRKRACRCIKGGFSPGVMGNFIRNASRLVPAVLYSGYKLMKNYTKTRKSRK